MTASNVKSREWRFEFGGTQKDWPQVVANDGTLIARTYGPEAESDARLIAAAPRMFERLKRDQAQNPLHGECGVTMERCNLCQVIADVEGAL